MNAKILYKFIDEERRLNYDSQSNLASKLGMTRQKYHTFMKNLKKNTPNGHFNKICYYLNKMGYELKIVKKTN